MTSRRSTQTPSSMSTLLVPLESPTVTTVAAVGILPSMAPSAALLDQLKGYFIWKPAEVLVTIFTVTATLKVTVITFTRERCEWDSGLESVTLARRMLTRLQAGVQCPGSSLKRCRKLSSEDVMTPQSTQLKSFQSLKRRGELLK